MSVYLYRLYAIQTFKDVKLAVYVCEGIHPDSQIINDALDIVRGQRNRREILEYNDWLYGKNEVYPNNGEAKRKELQYYTRVLKRSQEVMSKDDNVEFAIFVNSPNKRDWKGEKTLYKLKTYDMVKTDTPEFSGTEKYDTIKI